MYRDRSTAHNRNLTLANALKSTFDLMEQTFLGKWHTHVETSPVYSAIQRSLSFCNIRLTVYYIPLSTSE